jgi:hypothetical protein
MMARVLPETLTGQSGGAPAMADVFTQLEKKQHAPRLGLI